MITECNLIEWDDIGESVNVNNDFDLDLAPFEIKTFKIHQLKLDWHQSHYLGYLAFYFVEWQ